MSELLKRIVDLIEPLNNLLHPIQPILSFVASLFGLGTFAFIALLHWALRSLRDQSKDTEHKLKEAEKGLKYFTELSSNLAKEPERLMLEIEALKGIINTSHDDARQMAASLTEELSIANSKLHNALASTAYREGTKDDPVRFWAQAAVRWETYTEQLANSIPICFFGTQKGGVGKTMTSTNLAACFASRNERVLLVDLDYQGSSSAMLRRQAGKGNVAADNRPKSRIDTAFQTPPLNDNWTDLAIRRVNHNLDYIEAWYGFEALERSLEYRWIMSELGDDARYRLARLLLSPAIQKTYSRVILDAPPRFTMGFVNGICAATHVFVPTLVDAVSAGAVEHFFSQFKLLAPTVNPALQIKGVIGTVNTGNAQNALPQVLQRYADQIDREAKAVLGYDSVFIRNAVITRKAEIAVAAESGIPYMVSETIRPVYDKLADIVARSAPGRQSYESRAA